MKPLEHTEWIDSINHRHLLWTHRVFWHQRGYLSHHVEHWPRGWWFGSCMRSVLQWALEWRIP